MATRKSSRKATSKPATATVHQLPGTTPEPSKTERTYEGYSTVPLEDRVRRLEKRHRISDVNRSWQSSWTRRLTISTMLYVSTAMLLAMILIPGWYIAAIVPVIGYWTGGVMLWQMRSVWDTLPRKKS